MLKGPLSKSKSELENFENLLLRATIDPNMHLYQTLRDNAHQGYCIFNDKDIINSLHEFFDYDKKQLHKPHLDIGGCYPDNSDRFSNYLKHLGYKFGVTLTWNQEQKHIIISWKFYPMNYTYELGIILNKLYEQYYIKDLIVSHLEDPQSALYNRIQYAYATGQSGVKIKHSLRVSNESEFSLPEFGFTKVMINSYKIYFEWSQNDINNV